MNIIFEIQKLMRDGEGFDENLKKIDKIIINNNLLAFKKRRDRKYNILLLVDPYFLYIQSISKDGRWRKDFFEIEHKSNSNMIFRMVGTELMQDTYLFINAINEY